MLEMLSIAGFTKKGAFLETAYSGTRALFQFHTTLCEETGWVTKCDKDRYVFIDGIGVFNGSNGHYRRKMKNKIISLVDMIK